MKQMGITTTVLSLLVAVIIHKKDRKPTNVRIPPSPLYKRGENMGNIYPLS